VPRHVTRLVRRLVVDYFEYVTRPGASTHCVARHAARRRLLRLRRASGCLDTSRGSSCRSSSTTPPRAGSSSTTSPPPRVRVPRHVVRLVTRLVAPLVVDYSASHRLVVDYFAHVARPGASARRAARHAARRAARSGASASRRLVVDYFASAAHPGASTRRAARHAACRAARRRLLRLVQACRRLLRLRSASGCLGTSRGSSRGSSRRSSSTTPPHAGSSSTTPPRTGSSSTTSPTPRVRVPRHVARLATRPVALLVVDFSASCKLVATRPVASARRMACRVTRRAARRRLLCLAQARRRLLRLRCASGCLGSSRGSSCRSSSTTSPHAALSSITSPPLRVRVPRHVARLVSWIVARLVVDYFAYSARPGASARRAARRVARCAARRRLLRLRHASGCLGTSRGPSPGSSSTTPCTATSSCGHAGSTSAMSCVVTTCLTATLALLRVRCEPPRRRLPVASRRPFISTSFPN
jgi:hypothetical protein